jgi:hypothetical protein
MKTRWLAFLLIGLLFMGRPTLSEPQKNTPAPNAILSDDAKVLKGLKRVVVLVESLDKDVEAAGLKVENIQTDVELKLRQSGILVFPSKFVGILLHDGSPMLDVHVGMLKMKNAPAYAYFISLDLYQEVRLTHCKPPITDHAIIWRRRVIGVSSIEQVSRIREDVKDLVDEFCNDYLKANPKK